jgi:putative FmdB family regulatory protein
MKFDVRRSFSDETPARCPRCEGQAQRLFAAVPVIFNGSGFYVTDNRKNGSTPEKVKKSSASPEAAVKN